MKAQIEVYEIDKDTVPSAQSRTLAGHKKPTKQQ